MIWLDGLLLPVRRHSELVSELAEKVKLVRAKIEDSSG
jgi:hypothetical protein